MDVSKQCVAPVTVLKIISSDLEEQHAPEGRGFVEELEGEGRQNCTGA